MSDELAAHCRAVLSRHSRTFALASKLLPPQVRDEAATVYAWCRHVDDAVDAGGGAEALSRLEQELDAIYAGGEQSKTALAAFQRIVQRRHIPELYPRELLAGMRMDVDGVRYDDWRTLLRYCYRVAGTVGLMMCHVMGVRQQGALPHAARLGMGMQLTNICRDVLEDWHMGRLYLPGPVLERHGVGWLRRQGPGPFPESARAGVASSVRDVLEVAAGYYRDGDRGLGALSWRCAVAIRAARQLYSAIGDELARRGYDPTVGRAVVPARRRLQLVVTSSLHAVADLPPRFTPAWRSPPQAPATVLHFEQALLGHHTWG
jgi:phytoene synthase